MTFEKRIDGRHFGSFNYSSVLVEGSTLPVTPKGSFNHHDQSNEILHRLRGKWNARSDFDKKLRDFPHLLLNKRRLYLLAVASSEFFGACSTADARTGGLRRLPLRRTNGPTPAFFETAPVLHEKW